MPTTELMRRAPRGRVARGRFVHALVAFWVFFGWGLVTHASEGVDYEREIRPIFERTCRGAACHVGGDASGVDLGSYDATLASVGVQYHRPAVIPFDALGSPLWLKIARENPEFGVRMPRGGPPLPQHEIELVRRWIDEGAGPEPPPMRGDTTRDRQLDVSDAIFLLQYLFLGGPAPACSPVADVDASGALDIADAISLLDFLFLGRSAPPRLTVLELGACADTNVPPVVDPIGTVIGREGIALEFRVSAVDARGDPLTYSLESGPEGLTVGASTGVVSWTPSFGQAGDHRVRVRVRDDGVPALSAVATGLVRVLVGNRAPRVDPIGTRYAREGALLRFDVTATDAERDALRFELVDGPDGSTIDASTGTFEWLPRDGQAGTHDLTIRVVDSGLPPQSSEVIGQLICVARDAPENQDPLVPRRDIYRTYPGRPIRFELGASDPDGDTVTYSAANLPAGAALDSASGLFTWTPSDEQLGPSYVPVDVTDDGTPPRSVRTTLAFQVLPEDPCSLIECDPATGCTSTPRALEAACCAGPPEVRVAEPVADCPSGRVLHIGRNVRGFGRLTNCDLLPVSPFAQGGTTISIHIETRCVSLAEPSTLEMRIETEDRVLVNNERRVTLSSRTDGFAQRLGLVFTLPTDVLIFALDGEAALLSARLTDPDGVVVERRLRLVLALNVEGDLPEPDQEDVPAGEAGCVGCHRPLREDGERHGIEDAHPWAPLTCTDCHGGSADATTRALAHVSPGDGPADLRGLAADRLDEVDPEYLQFVNPSDLRVAERGCGRGSPANPGGGCHQSIVDRVQLSVMTTFAGHYTLPRFLAGTQGREQLFAAVDVRDPDYDPLTAPDGALEMLRALREPEPDADRSSVGSCMDIYLPKSCPSCHLSDFGTNNATGNYRSSGCAGCHMLYDEDGLSRSDDPTISKEFPSHPRTHALTSAIPTEQCERCHFQGGRIGLGFNGSGVGGFWGEKTPPHATPLGRDLHAHAPDYYFVDEDSRNHRDETPPDLHHSAGMVCADCHVGGDVHGDGNLYGSEHYQIGVRCEDCHGTVRAEIRADPKDGQFKNSAGFALKRLRRDGDRVVLQLRTGDRELEVPQIHRILESGVNQAMVDAMGVNEQGFSHTDKMECYTCHTSWRQTCFGCHVTVDDSGSARNLTTGEITRGAISVSRDDYSIDFFALGTNESGKISPLCNSMSVFVTYVDENGETRYRDRVRTSRDGRQGFGWNPFHHHTVSRVPQNCDACHPSSETDNSARLRETFGFGNGRYIGTDGDGQTYDLTAFLDEDGQLISEFPHPNTGPLSEEVRRRALEILVTPHPRHEE